ncbi:Copia protein, partial [Mucuna pruriens]
MAHGIYEGLLMKIILNDLKVKYEGPIKLLCDNNSTISIGYNPVQQDRTKQIEINRHFIKEKLNSRLVVTTHVPIGLQVANIFTKGLPVARFQELNGYYNIFRVGVRQANPGGSTKTNPTSIGVTINILKVQPSSACHQKPKPRASRPGQDSTHVGSPVRKIQVERLVSNQSHLGSSSAPCHYL